MVKQSKNYPQKSQEKGMKKKLLLKKISSRKKE